MKFIVGVAIGYWIAHPYNEDNKLDRATMKVVRKGGEKLGDFIIKRVVKVMGS